MEEGYLQTMSKKEGAIQMKKEEIDKALRHGYFGEYNGEIDFLLTRIRELIVRLKIEAGR